MCKTAVSESAATRGEKNTGSERSCTGGDTLTADRPSALNALLLVALYNTYAYFELRIISERPWTQTCLS